MRLDREQPILNRTKKLLHHFDKNSLCMEIGPGYNPLLPKRDGWRTISVDHADQAGLVEKYKRFDVNTAAIEEVDVVWAGGELSEAVPQSILGTVDACVASHVIEHIPNPVVFFQSMSKILKPGGLLSLAVPDKRYCFDFFQPLTCTGDWLHAWKRNAHVHSQRALFQHIAYTVIADGATTWGQFTHLKEIRFLTDSLPLALKRFSSYAEDGTGAYQDCHAWHFTPGSFDLLMLELSQLGLIPFTVAQTHPSYGCEFFVLLHNSAPPPIQEQDLQRRRIELLREIAGEQAVSALLLRPNPARSLLAHLRRSLTELVRRLRRGGRS